MELGKIVDVVETTTPVSQVPDEVPSDEAELVDTAIEAAEA